MTKKEIRQEMTRGAIWLIFAFGLAMVTRGISIKDSDKVASKEELDRKASIEYVDKQDESIIKMVEREDTQIMHTVEEYMDYNRAIQESMDKKIDILLSRTK